VGIDETVLEGVDGGLCGCGTGGQRDGENKTENQSQGIHEQKHTGRFGVR